MDSLYRQVCTVEVLKQAFLKGLRKNSRAGPDGVSWRDIRCEVGSFLILLQDDIIKSTYCPGKPEKKEISHYLKSDKYINFEIVNIRDRIVEYAIRIVLEPLYEREFLPSVCAYRPCKGEKYFVKMIERNILDGFTWIACADIKSFFSSIDISILIDELLAFTQDEKLIGLIKKCLCLEEKKNGIPLGHILSPFLSNVFLHPIDLKLKEKRFIRFSDDWFFPRKIKNGYINDIDYLGDILQSRKLNLNRQKTKIVFNPNPLDLLIP